MRARRGGTGISETYPPGGREAPRRSVWRLALPGGAPRRFAPALEPFLFARRADRRRGRGGPPEVVAAPGVVVLAPGVVVAAPGVVGVVGVVAGGAVLAPGVVAAAPRRPAW